MGRPMEMPTFEEEPAPTPPSPGPSFPLQQRVQVLQMVFAVLVTLASILVLMAIPPILVLIEVIVFMVVDVIPSLTMAKGGQAIVRAIKMPQYNSERARQACSSV